MWKKRTGHCCKNRTKCSKNCFQKEVHKTARATGELIGDKIARKNVKPKSAGHVNSRFIEDVVISAEKRPKNIDRP